MSMCLIQWQVRLNTAMDLTRGSHFFLYDFVEEQAHCFLYRAACTLTVLQVTTWILHDTEEKRVFLAGI